MHALSGTTTSPPHWVTVWNPIKKEHYELFMATKFMEWPTLIYCHWQIWNPCKTAEINLVHVNPFLRKCSPLTDACMLFSHQNAVMKSWLDYVTPLNTLSLLLEQKDTSPSSTGCLHFDISEVFHVARVYRDHAVLPVIHTFMHKWNEPSCLCSPATAHHRLWPVLKDPSTAQQHWLLHAEL